MPCASYSDPRLAAVYDPLNPSDDDILFYLDLAGETPKTVLDMGCGTGRLACELAARGHQVTGADPAAAMLDIARSRSGGEKVTWIETKAADLSVDTRFDLIIMTGHVFQVFLDDQDVRAALRTLHQHLAPGGRVAFETRNPAVQEWSGWTPEETHERVEVAGVGTVEVHYDITSVAGPFVTFETHFRFAEDDILVAPTTLRFMNQDELAAFLADAGFTDVTWYGDWDRSAVSPTSPEIIAIAG
ncbi:class I SAM-dependent methyltransferase [Rhodospirillaceae bacterium SYSU D60014]|uniref:methyltransferase domain-containing protein n=1 Tax=Virgifigura deserti TaxID=2268457 RepID=UPI000E66C792